MTEIIFSSLDGLGSTIRECDVIREKTNYTTLGGRVTCTRCGAKSKRTKQQCRNPAIKGKTKCRHHGGLSTGSRTPAGKARQIAANTKHGRETRAIRKERSAKLAELYQLEMLGRELGLISGGMVGRKTKKSST